MHKIEHIGIAVKTLSVSIPLFENLLNWNRYSTDVTPTVGTVTVQSIRRRKKQTPIEIPFCCEAFDPAELVQTQISWGEVEGAVHSTDGGLTLTLMHE